MSDWPQKIHHKPQLRSTSFSLFLGASLVLHALLGLALFWSKAISSKKIAPKTMQVVWARTIVQKTQTPSFKLPPPQVSPRPKVKAPKEQKINIQPPKKDEAKIPKKPDTPPKAVSKPTPPKKPKEKTQEEPKDTPEQAKPEETPEQTPLSRAQQIKDALAALDQPTPNEDNFPTAPEIIDQPMLSAQDVQALEATPEMMAYNEVIQEKVTQNFLWYQAGEGLITEVEISLAPDGQVQNLKLFQSSNNQSFDQATMRAIQKSSPFPPPPGKLQKLFLQESIVFIFDGNQL